MIPGIRNNFINLGACTPAPSTEQGVQSVQYNFMEMLTKLTEKLEHLEQRIHEERP